MLVVRGCAVPYPRVMRMALPRTGTVRGDVAGEVAGELAAAIAGDDGAARDVGDVGEGNAEAITGEAAPDDVPVAALLAAPVMVPAPAAEHPASVQRPSAAVPARDVFTSRILRAPPPPSSSASATKFGPSAIEPFWPGHRYQDGRALDGQRRPPSRMTCSP